jgi:deazaflavin-dependent oxidoreductase (nitroreductase family)
MALGRAAGAPPRLLGTPRVDLEAESRRAPPTLESAGAPLRETLRGGGERGPSPLGKVASRGAMADLRFRILGSVHRRVYRLTGGKLGGQIGKLPVLLLTTIGRKSGQPRTQPLAYTHADDGYAVIASKGGAAQHPLWYLNLKANPLAEVTVGRETRKVRARDAQGEERERLWRALADLYRGYDRYAQKTSRQIPVVVLEPAAG